MNKTSFTGSIVASLAAILLVNIFWNEGGRYGIDNFISILILIAPIYIRSIYIKVNPFVPIIFTVLGGYFLVVYILFDRRRAHRVFEFAQADG